MKELNFIEIGSRIRKYREAMFLTQEAFAEKLDVSVKFVRDIETGAKGMSLKTLNRISDCLLISTDNILYGSADDEGMSELIHLLGQCPREKRPYAEELLKVFIRSCN